MKEEDFLVLKEEEGAEEEDFLVLKEEEEGAEEEDFLDLKYRGGKCVSDL